MDICAANERDQLELAMTGLVKELRSLADDRGHAREVDQSQAAWSAYADNECQVSGLAFEGGTMRVPQTGFCRVGLIESRIRDLQGDLRAWK